MTYKRFYTLHQEIPAEVKLKAACTMELGETNEYLKPYLVWNKTHLKVPYSIDRVDYKSIFDFDKESLLAYMTLHPEIYKKLLGQSYDKRYTPSSFIEETEGAYRVGWFDKTESQTRIFQRFPEAATDYVLLSWGLGRL